MFPRAAVRHAGAVTIVDLEGRIAFDEGCGLVRNTVRELLNGGSRNILLNLQGVSYVDSSGLGEMAGSCVTVARLGGQLKLVHSHARIHNMLQVTKLYALLVTFNDEEEALRSFDAQPS
jgi:anti-sigma B factor antagonist